jgi:SAM-dependent methyltransferase
VASLYDEVRPGYPERLFDDLASLSGTGPGTRALESGCGTGQATLPLARRGYRFAVARDAESYLRFLGTFSSHRVLDERTRGRLFAAVGRLIEEEYRGRVIEGYRSELYVSRKR